MLVIFEAKGFQWIGDVGTKLKIPYVDREVGDEITFDKVLLHRNDKIEIGKPYVKGVNVKAEITEQGRHPKILVYKYKRRKRYRNTRGHKQKYTEIEIKDIVKTKKKKKKKKKKKEKEKKGDKNGS